MYCVVLTFSKAPSGHHHLTDCSTYRQATRNRAVKGESRKSFLFLTELLTTSATIRGPDGESSGPPLKGSLHHCGLTRVHEMTPFSGCFGDSSHAHRTWFLNGLGNLLCCNCKHISVFFNTDPRGSSHCRCSCVAFRHQGRKTLYNTIQHEKPLLL